MSYFLFCSQDGARYRTSRLLTQYIGLVILMGTFASALFSRQNTNETNQSIPAIVSLTLSHGLFSPNEAKSASGSVVIQLFDAPVEMADALSIQSEDASSSQAGAVALHCQRRGQLLLGVVSLSPGSYRLQVAKSGFVLGHITVQ